MSLTRLIAGLVMKQPTQQEMLMSMFAMYRDILEDAWVYQEILKEGLDKGEQRVLLAILQKRFPDIVPFVRQRLSGITDTNLLESLIGDVSVAHTSQEALEVLSVLNSNGQTNSKKRESEAS